MSGFFQLTQTTKKNWKHIALQFLVVLLYIPWIVTGKQVYKIFVQHGYGGGKKNGSKLNNLNASDGIVANADMYIMGHTHTPIANVMSTFLCDEQNRQVYRHNKYYLMHNAYLDFGGYGLRQGFSPAAKELTTATLFTQGRKRIRLSIGM